MASLRTLLFFLFTFSASASENPYADLIRFDFSRHGVKALRDGDLPRSNPHVFALGRLLYFDKILSGNKNISCSTCHHQNFASGDELPVSFGEGGTGLGRERDLGKGHLIPRNAPPVFNRLYVNYHTLMWDARISRDPKTGILTTPEASINGVSPDNIHITQELKSPLAAQALFPISSEHEMLGYMDDNDVAVQPNRTLMWEKLTERVVAIDKYMAMFKKAYSTIQTKEDVNIGHIANALGQFEGEVFLANDSKFDHFLKGENSLSSEELEGAALFLGKAKCINCHNGPFLTDFKGHALATPQLGPGKSEEINDRGYEWITKDVTDRYKFKTPSLRNTAITGPWMHDGYFTNLKDVIRHHLNPEKSLLKNILAVNSQSHKDIIIATLDRDEQRNQERLSYVLRDEVEASLTEKEIHQLYLFLNTLTDRSFKKRMNEPTSVPSGLEID